MARSLNSYERQYKASGVQESARGSIASEGGELIGQALQNLGNQGMAFAGQQMKEQRNQVENDAAIMASNELSMAETQWDKYSKEKFQAWKVGDESIQKTLNADFDAYKAETVKRFPTPASQLYVTQHLDRMKAKLLNSAGDYEQKAFTTKMNADTEVGIAADANIVFSDPSRLGDVFQRRAETIISRDDINEGDKIKAVSKLRESLYLSTERGELERDPSGWYAQRFGAKQAVSVVQPKVAGAVTSEVVGNAIFGQESNSGKADTSKFNSQNVIGPMQIQQGTFDGMKRMGIIPDDFDIKNPEQNKQAGFAWVDYLSKKYEGDPAKVAAAYYGGEKAVSSDGTIKREMRNLKRPSDPSVGEYVDQVLARIGKESEVEGSTAELKTSAQAEVEAPSSYSGLGYEQQLQLKRFAETRIKQDQAVRKSDAQGLLRDASAMHKDGLQDSFNFGPDYFNTAFGPVEGPQQYAEYRNSRDMAADIGNFKSQSEGEILSEIAQSRPTQSEGYAAADGRYNLRVQAAQQVLEKRAKDPAAAVLGTNERLAQQANSLSQLPPPGTPENQAQRTAAYSKYASDSIAEQTRLGIANPAILTESMAGSLVSQFNKAVGNGDDMATRIAQTAQDWGPQWNNVYRQLATKYRDNLPDSFLTIPGVESPSVRETIARLDHVKMQDLEKLVQKQDIDFSNKEITTGLNQFAKSMFINKTNSDTYNAIFSAAKKMTLEKIAGGMDRSKAVTSSVNSFIDKYEFSDESSINTYAIPKTEMPDLVVRGVGQIMNEFDNLDIAPPPIEQRGEQRNPQEMLSAWRARIKEAPIWATNDSEDGLKLFAQGFNGARYPVLTSNGAQVEFLFSELRDSVAQKAAMNMQGNAQKPRSSFTPSGPVSPGRYNRGQ